jgi:uncharacterized membrane protein
MLIFIVSMMITAWVLLFSGVIGFGTYIYEMFGAGLSLPNIIGLVGFGLMMFGMVTLIGLWMLQFMVILWKKMIYWFSKLAHKRGE